MTAQQAYINGFVKRASEYGLNHNEAISLLKSALDPAHRNGLGAALSTPAKGKPQQFMGPTNQGYERMHPADRASLRLPTPPAPLPELQGPTSSGLTLDTMSNIDPAHANDLGQFTR